MLFCLFFFLLHVFLFFLLNNRALHFFVHLLPSYPGHKIPLSVVTFTRLPLLTLTLLFIFAGVKQDLLQRNHLELLKFTGASYQEVLEIQRAVGKAIIPKVQTVSTSQFKGAKSQYF